MGEETDGTRGQLHTHYISIFDVPSIGLVAVYNLSEGEDLIEGFVASRQCVVQFDPAIFFRVSKFVEYVAESRWDTATLLFDATTDHNSDGELANDYPTGVKTVAQTALCNIPGKDEELALKVDAEIIGSYPRSEYADDERTGSNDWRSTDSFRTYLTLCRSMARQAVQKEARLEERAEAAEWVALFQLIKLSRKHIDPLAFFDNLLIDGANEQVAACRFGHFPWRLALVEVVIKLGIQDVASALGRVVSGLEKYPSWQSPLNEEYRFFSIKKRSGGRRRIQVPSDWLKALQRSLYAAIARLVAAHPACHGFETGRSILSNALPHCRQPIVVRYDIKTAFESTSRAAVEAALRRDLATRTFSDRALKLLGEVVTYSNALPTGAPSSPFLLNRVLHQADEEISVIASSSNVAYSRYADDLTLSGPTCLRMHGDVKRILSKLGYAINTKKTRVYRKGTRQLVTGLVVNQVPNLPREKRRKLRAAVYEWEQHGSANWAGEVVTESSLRGHLVYYAMTNPSAAWKLFGRLPSGIKKAAGD